MHRHGRVYYLVLFCNRSHVLTNDQMDEAKGKEASLRV